ncbi:MAG: DUF3473 domain-containing protein [Planctomycetota bacterium]
MIGTRLQTPVKTSHALSFDIEDWPQAYLDPRRELTSRFECGTKRILNLLDENKVKATFFVLGLAAEKCPHLVREIQSRGHEVQSHGYGHRLIHTQTPSDFRGDVEHSKKLLEDLCGRPIRGYRAPAFSITRKTLWALDVLIETGFQFDSSIFPIVMPRYGIAGALSVPHQVRAPNGGELIEMPVATARAFGHVLPVGGGGYFRWMPYGLIRRGVQQHSRAGQSATLYLHPHEFDPNEFREMRYGISWVKRAKFGWGRKRVPGVVDRLLKTFPFQTMGQVVASLRDLPVCAYSSWPLE